MIRITFLLYMSLFFNPLFAQDTIFVSNQYKSYLIFDQPVSLVDVGNPSFYEVRIEGSGVFVVALDKETPTVPLYIVTGEEIFTGMLSGQKQAAPFYDFRKGNTDNHVADNKIPKTFLQKRMNILSDKQNLNYGTSKTGGITFRLCGLMHDLKYSYFKFCVKNNSSVVYQTDFVGFEQIRRYKKGFFAKEKEARFPVTPVASQKVQPILPYGEGYFYYVLPLHALGKKETLEVSLRESRGNRTLILKIPPRYIRKADLH